MFIALLFSYSIVSYSELTDHHFTLFWVPFSHPVLIIYFYNKFLFAVLIDRFFFIRIFGVYLQSSNLYAFSWFN